MCPAARARLRSAANRYPADQRVRRLIAELRAKSDAFVEMWDSGTVIGPETSRKIIDHRRWGP